MELFQQLRGDAVDRVNDARIDLPPNVSVPAAVSAVTVLEGPRADGA